MTVAHISEKQGGALGIDNRHHGVYNGASRRGNPGGSNWGCASDWNDPRTGRSNIDCKHRFLWADASPVFLAGNRWTI